MKKLLAGMAALGALLLAMQVYGQMGMMGRCGMMGSMIRHRHAMMNGIGQKYVNKTNPLTATAETIRSGKKLYNQDCAYCHGVTGLGDGPGGKNLNPRPTDIAAFSKMRMATDGYLYWTIAEGGVPLGTSMPAYKGFMKQNQIWEIITYLRTL